MNQRRTENFIMLLVTMACIGLVVESIVLDWEFWVPPLIIIGTLYLWYINISESVEYRIRKHGYLIYAMLTIAFHGVHASSFFDVAIVISLVMLAFSFFDHLYMMNFYLAEYIVIMFIQFVFLIKGNVIFDTLNISRIILHMMIVCLTYFCCNKAITDRIETRLSDEKKDEQIENYDADMEDFLSNISHELRTPVNVVNGMSELLIKRNIGSEAYSIKDAGLRLAYQIEDIQDYTECKRNKVMLEEEEYISTSLINDVVTSFRLLDNNNELELVVDMAPSVPTKMSGDIKKLHKIFRHLLENAVKFTKKGGIYVRMYSEDTDYGVNLCIEMTDTGIGMDRRAIASVSEGMYQVNKKRNRSSGGIGLGLYIVYGFAHRMNGFVKIESEKDFGTTIRVTIPQRVIDDSPCLSISHAFDGDILLHVRSDKYRVARIRDFYRSMASNLASGIKVPLYSAESVKEIEKLRETLNVTNIFMGQEEYEENREYFDKLSMGNIVIAVSAGHGIKADPDSRVIIMPKPLYAYPIIKILNEGIAVKGIDYTDNYVKPEFTGVKALIVDDEPMNLVVATSLFSEYKMEIDTAGSGKEAIKKYISGDYDIVFMDHMMPEMDGVEAMKRIKRFAEENGRNTKIVVLTANVVSGAKEMFLSEGFVGFISKPINIADFERVMLGVLPKNDHFVGGKRV